MEKSKGIHHYKRYALRKHRGYGRYEWLRRNILRLYQILLSDIKFILIPLFWVVCNIIGNSMKGLVVTDNVIVESRLPLKIRLNHPCIFGYPNFESTNNRG